MNRGTILPPQKKTIIITNKKTRLGTGIFLPYAEPYNSTFISCTVPNYFLSYSSQYSAIV